MYSQQTRFSHITINDGLSQSEVYCFLEDKYGFMWIGTLNGLNRYDGYTIENFHTEKDNKHAIPNTTIRALCEDENDRVWIGTENGICYYNQYTEKINQIDFNDSSLKVSSLLYDNQKLFIASNLGIFLIDFKNANLKPKKLNVGSFKEYKNIKSIKKSDHGVYWMLGNNNIVSFYLTENSNTIVEIDKTTLNEEIIFKDLEIDKTGNLWITTEKNGLIRYHIGKKQSTFYLPNKNNYSIASKYCSKLLIDKDDNLWVSTRDKGISFLAKNEIKNKTFQFKTISYHAKNKNGLSSNLIYRIYATRDKTIWIGTIGSGIDIYDASQNNFKYLSTESINSENTTKNHFIRSLFLDSKDNLWIGKQNNGLYIHQKNETRKVGFETQNIFHISHYKNNLYFIGTSFGLTLISYENNQISIIDQIFNSACLDLIQIDENTFYAASVYGLKKFQLNNLKLSNIKTITTHNTRVLYFDKKSSYIYVGTEGNGLLLLGVKDEKIHSSYTTKNSSISSNYIRAIALDNNENIWIGTYEGLLKAEPVKNKLTFKKFTLADGLPNNMIQSIINSNDGNLWLGTNFGLTKLNVEKENFINYSIIDGLQSNEFSENTCVLNQKNNRIYIGGNNGITYFSPEDIRISKSIAKPVFTKFRLGNKMITPRNKYKNNESILRTKKIYLDSDENNFSIEFSSMLHTSAIKSKYQYKLEGYDDMWWFTDAKSRRATYTNLPHGTYTFKVKATNADGVWNNKPTSVGVFIDTPFIYTNTAYATYILTILFLIYFIVTFFLTKEKEKLSNLNSQKLAEINTIRTEFFMNASHDIRTPLTLISTPLNSLIKNFSFSPEVDGQLRVIKRNVKKLKHLTDQLLDIRKAETAKLKVNYQNIEYISFVNEEISHFDYQLKEKGLSLEFNSTENQSFVKIDTDKISKIIFNLLSNALKNTEKGGIKIIIDFDSKLEKQPYIKTSIIDSGTGIPKSEISKIFNRFYQENKFNSKGYGIGLAHCNELINIIGGKLKIESKLEEGTKIDFYIPYIKGTTNTKEIQYKQEEIEEEFISKNNTKHKILLIEDNAEMRFYIKYELEKQFEVVEAIDGSDGIIKALDVLPDLIVTDNMMPNLTGIEMCQQLKQNIKTSHIPIIILTANPDENLHLKSIKIGADDFLSKPFDMIFLELKIENLIKNRETLKNKYLKNLNLSPADVEVDSIDDLFVKKLKTIIEKEVSNSEFNVSALEKEIGMSHANFYRKIKTLTGMSGIEILNDFRLKRAYQLLKDNGNIRINEVTYMTGFTNPKYFSKIFKEKFGVSPSQVKRIKE